MYGRGPHHAGAVGQACLSLVPCMRFLSRAELRFIYLGLRGRHQSLDWPGSLWPANRVLESY